MIDPGLVTCGPELPFVDGDIENKPADTIEQSGNDAHERFDGGAAERAGGRFEQDGVVILEGAVGSFGCRAQGVQLPVSFGASGDFEKETGPSGNGDVGGEAELFRSMGAVAEEFEDGRIFGFDALLEAGEGEPLGCGVESVGARWEVTV